MNRIAAAALLAALLSTTGAHSQQVYRCGSTYTQVPCSDGRQVDVSDPRTEEQRAQALQVAAEDHQKAKQYDRRLQIQAARPANAVILKPQAPKRETIVPAQPKKKVAKAKTKSQQSRKTRELVKPIVPIKAG